MPSSLKQPVRWVPDENTLQAIVEDDSADLFVRVRAARLLTSRASIELEMAS
jgi:hypothetical protein